MASTAVLLTRGLRFAPAAFAESPPIRAAMHVHGCWSEGGAEYGASWAQQCAQAAANGIDVMWMTDHTHHQEALKLASGFAFTEDETTWVTATSPAGSLAQVTFTGAGVTLAAQAQLGKTPTTASLTLAEEAACCSVRTSIAGHVLSLSYDLATAGASFAELRIPLSMHPATGSRPAGTYALCYRLGLPAGRHTEAGGIVGVVHVPATGRGQTLRADLTTDAAAFWPDLVPFDQCLSNLELRVVSTAPGEIVRVAFGSLTIARSSNGVADVLALERILIDRYGLRFPSVRLRASSEFSNLDPHVNFFGASDFLPTDARYQPSAWPAAVAALISEVHRRGGVTSYNHPFGPSSISLDSKEEQDRRRRTLFATLQAVRLYGTDILETGYAARGNASFVTHLALFDALCAGGLFLTANGANDNHGAIWRNQPNGFVTGLWAPSTNDADLVAALRSGRCFLYLGGRWAAASIDTLVDGTVPMGKVSVSPASSRTLDVATGGLPAGGRLELVLVKAHLGAGASADPPTTVTDLGSARTARVRVTTTEDVVVRVQVRDGHGVLVASSNPTWLLRAAPPGGIPPARVA